MLPVSVACGTGFTSAVFDFCLFLRFSLQVSLSAVMLRPRVVRRAAAACGDGGGCGVRRENSWPPPPQPPPHVKTHTTAARSRTPQPHNSWPGTPTKTLPHAARRTTRGRSISEFRKMLMGERPTFTISNRFRRF
ncbi:hypothetical protein L596_011768 [Steinernema carpocapsae]|uniref:Uncharacterized protein n=1 Tax=Steinernema carpocapsae TaxID=34508 RepID=A0A4U5NVW7_STECR|nr:hypothetical protein L596_011768 [Steinernema carpocapsae]